MFAIIDENVLYVYAVLTTDGVFNQFLFIGTHVLEPKVPVKPPK